MLWAVRRKNNFVGDPLSSNERDHLVDYFLRVNARKYALDPNCSWPEVMFVADAIMVSSGAPKYRVPDGFEVFSADSSYMPLAWGGTEAESENSINWFTVLPNEHKSL